ncbi:hypothetical protein BCR22_05695 [Enterococcus plantarum]|nr:hypothetical protein BCR22_05695 [Enterococcus plantarum]
MRIFRNYYKLINNFYNESSNFIKLSILTATFITSLLIKEMLFENIDGIFGYILGLTSFLILFSLYSYLFYKINH